MTVSTPGTPDTVDKTSQDWYFRLAGEVFGPYDYGRLRNVLAAARIERDFEVKQTADGAWRQVASAANLLEQAERAASTVAARCQARPVPLFAVASSPLNRQLSLPGPGAANQPKSTVETRRPKQSFLRGFSRREAVTLAALLLLWPTVNAVVLGSFSRAHALEREATREIQLIWDEFQSLRRSRASDSQWASLQTRAEEKLAPLIRSLEKTASAAHPVQQHLLTAARDHLRIALLNGRQRPSDSERLFQKHMEESRRLLATGR
jgi:hypothetical protein